MTASLQGQVLDASGGGVPKAKVSAVNTETAFSRSTESDSSGEYSLPAMPAGRYTVSAQLPGFKTDTGEITLQVGQVATLNFKLAVGEVSEKVEVQAQSEVTEPTRTQISNVITQNQIRDLPVNGREFIDFALLSPGVQIGDTTSGSTDVIVEPVTKISFAGQNIHFNFIAVDGADDISTASGIQRGTPPQDSVQEFRVINTDYSTEYGRATAGIVNIITRSGTNDWHGTLYEYFRNNNLDAKSVLSVPGFNVLRQNQFGAAIGGPIQKDKTFIYANYEGQRRAESPTYNSVVLNNIDAINAVKTEVYGLPAENLFVLRDSNTDNGFVRIDHNFNTKNYLFARYFINDDRLTNQSPLNNGFDLPSAFKNNYIRDQSLAGGLTSTLSPSWINELRMQYAHRNFDFPVVSTQPHLEVANTFAVGVNRGNPDIYTESRFEIVDNVTHNFGNHTLSFGGNYDHVNTYESFPLFYPFEADFANLPAFLGTDGVVHAVNKNLCAPPAICPDPFVVFFERFSTTTDPLFNEGALVGGTAIYQGGPISQSVRRQASATLTHTYNGLFIQDKWRVTPRLTVNGGLRWEFETWPSGVLNTQWNNFDPRLGVAYNLGTSRNVVFRAGFGLFHGIIPSPLLMCQAPSCGGLSTFPGRDFENQLNARTGLFSFASSPDINFLALNALLTQGTYPNGTPEAFCPGGTLAGCGFLQDATIVRFDKGSENPYGIQASASIEFQPFRDSVLSISGIHLRGVHLGSFYNVNQPDPSGTVQVFDSNGTPGCKNVYFNFEFTMTPPTTCPDRYPAGFVIPGTPHINAIPGFRDPQFSVFFEARSSWDSVYDGLLVNFTRRLSHHFSVEASYTYAHSIDDGPNPSFVLIPQDSNAGNFRAERANSADDIRHRFVSNAIFTSPAENKFLRDFTFSTILTFQSPPWFTKYAGFDANGDVFGNNDRVGSEPRNTFRGDSLQTIDIRLERTFPIHERFKLQLMFEAFNLFNTVNVKYFNTSYGAADFCPFDAGAPGCAGVNQFFKEGSPNPSYGTPSAVFNPRQLQLAARINF
ncbi:MAG TPA: TonB-dependent receptor [Candidatus Acidoferrales bacterium]|nr:TonB-dependent receptor [Candidatus Acidoferrales bacterium]